VRSLGRAGYDVLVASHRRAPLAAWSRFARARHVAAENRSAFAALRAWAAAQGVTVVLPLTERSCLLCNAERPAWEAAGITVGCGSDDILVQAFDKGRTLAHAEACGVAIPPTRWPASWDDCRAAADELGYPCVVKPRFSNVLRGDAFLSDAGPRYVARPEQLVAAVTACRQGADWPLIQAYVPGRGKGVFALCDHGRAVTWFAHERLRDVRPTGSGSSLRRATPVDPALQAAARRLIARLRWHGPVMVEFQADGSADPLLMEVNGRFWGSLQLAVAAGVDFPRLWVEMLRGQEPRPPASYTTGVTVRWLWGDVKRLLHILGGPVPGHPGPHPALRQGLRELLGAQPPGTQLETWQRDDAWPAVGEWIQGMADLARGLTARLFSRRPPSAPLAPLPPDPRPAVRDAGSDRPSARALENVP
jgi:predicted ATP-grasp superfamily ATP-dependent carboligase